jgi:hypothetical protein
MSKPFDYPGARSSRPCKSWARQSRWNAVSPTDILGKGLVSVLGRISDEINQAVLES